MLSIIKIMFGCIIGFIVGYLLSDGQSKCPRCHHKNTKKELYCHSCQTKLS